MKRGELVQTVGEVAEVVEGHDVRLEPGWIGAPADLRDDPLHPAIIQIVDYVKHANSALHR